MSTKVNLVLEDDVKRSLDQLVPAGRRSEFANEALQTHLTQLKRRRAIEKLEALRRKGPAVATEEVVQLLRQGRETLG